MENEKMHENNERTDGVQQGSENLSASVRYCIYCGCKAEIWETYCKKCGKLLSEKQRSVVNNDSAVSVIVSTTTEKRGIVKWPFFAFGIPVMVIVLIIILFSSVCFHEWRPASCTEPKTCIECGKIEGEPLGHIAGQVEAYTNYVTAKIVMTTPCERCDENIERNEIAMQKFHDKSNFTFSPVQFSLRMNSMLDGIEGCTLKAECESVGNAVVCNIVNSRGVNVGYVGFMDKESVFTPSRKNGQGITSIMMVVKTSDSTYFAEMLIAVIRTCDPSISFGEAKEFGSKLVGDSVSEKNGLNYSAFQYSGEWLVGVGIT